MMIKIEKNVPLPSRNGSRGKYPFAEMEVGDSFFISDIKIHKASGLYGGAGKRLGRKFAGRAEGDGVRVWRVA